MTTPTPTVPENLKARLKDSYDAIATTYNDQFGGATNDTTRTHYLKQFLSHLENHTTQEAKVLELGCGAGDPVIKTLLAHPAPRISVIGNDLSSAQLELARQNLSADTKRLELVQGDMMALDFAPGSLDGVVAFYSIIHLPREEQSALVKKIHGWLKPGGLFLGNFSEEEIDVAVNESWLKQEKGWMFWSGWGKEKSVKEVGEAGFEVLVNEVTEDIVDANFLWVLARKK